MSTANDETLLEEEDGEDEYDLGNEEEEALLAEDDDQEPNHENISYLKKCTGRKSQYTGENKIYRDSEDIQEDDFLDLDDVETDILDNTEYAEEVDFNETQDDLGADEQQEAVMAYHDQEVHKPTIKSEVNESHSAASAELGIQGFSSMVKDQPLKIKDEPLEGRKDSEDEEEEEKDEGRGRFKSERTTVISLKGSKSYGNIPDTLDSVITGDDKVETAGRWKRSGGGRGGGPGFQRGGFRGNQRGFGPNFGARRKQMGQNRQGGHQGGMGYIHGRSEGPPDSMRDVIGPPPSQFMLSQNIHFNPHFKGNILPQPEGPPWNEGSMGNPPPSSGGAGGPPSHASFHDLQRFPPPPVGGYGGGGGGDHHGGDMLSSFADHHRQQRQRSPPPPLHSAYLSAPGGRSGGYDSPPSHPDYHRDEPYDNRRPPHPDTWNGPNQRMPEGSMGLPSGGHHHHHHQYSGHFPTSPGIHGERGGGGDVLQHFRPTMQPGPLFSHVAPPSVALPVAGIPNQQSLMMQQQQQQHLQNLLRSAPPMHGNGGGMGQHMMQQMPPQEQPHSRIPPPGFSPNEARSIPSVHHGMSLWHDPPINRSPMEGQHMSMQQQQQQQPQQQHSSFHHGGAPRPFLGERPGAIQGAPMHHHASVASMSAPPPPFHSGNIPQGPHPQHAMQHSPMRQNAFNSSSMASGGGNSGGHNNGRFPRQGNLGNFQQQGFTRTPPSHQGVRPNRGSGHMSQGRGGLGARRGMGTPNTRPMPVPKSAGEDVFPPKRPSLQDGPSPAMKVSPPKKRKVRKIVKNNLLEVETVDTLPDTTTTGEKEATVQREPGNNARPPEPVDAEVLEYQKKIERQKQLREEVLRRKEQRRKLMALQKQKELQEKAVLSGEASSDVPKGNAIATIVNRNPVEPSPSVVQSVPVIKKEPMANQAFIPPMNPGQPIPEAQPNQAQLLAARRKALIALKAARGQGPAQPMGRGMAIRGMRGGMANQQLISHNLVTIGNSPGPVQQVGQRTKIIQVKNEQGQLVRKKVPIRPGMAGRGTMMGRGQGIEGSPQPGRSLAQGRGQMVVNKQGQQVQAPGGIHRLVQMLPPQQNNPQNQEPKAQSNKILQRVVKVNVPVPNQQQPQGRKVVVQNVGGAGGAGDCISAEGVIASGSVVVENLAVTTTESDLRKMCSSVGRVKSIRMVPGMRSAWVEFAQPTLAATFCQRYQRKIVDLSMITVRLANS